MLIRKFEGQSNLAMSYAEGFRVEKDEIMVVRFYHPAAVAAATTYIGEHVMGNSQ